MIQKIILFTIAAVLFFGCHTGHEKTRPGGEATHEHGNHGSHDHEHDHDDHGSHDHDHEHTDAISFTKEQAEQIGLTTVTMALGTFHQVIKTSGHVQAAQGDEATVVATADGTVSFVNPSISEGIPVRAGEAIVTITAKHLQNGDPATKARIEFETARREYQRAETLVEDRKSVV